MRLSLKASPAPIDRYSIPDPSVRREMRDGLSERGLLPDGTSTEAVLNRAMSALEGVADPRLEGRSGGACGVDGGPRGRTGRGPESSARTIRQRGLTGPR